MNPAFVAPDERVPDQRVESPHEVAMIAAARDALKLDHGLLVTVPVPVVDELPAADAEQAIAEATRLADEAGITGKDVTPFVLGKVLELTEGRSQAANIAALVNNARVAARIALALAQ
jgi:pseudouridine-5'-phosphate glycosidase